MTKRLKSLGLIVSGFVLAAALLVAAQSYADTVEIEKSAWTTSDLSALRIDTLDWTGWMKSTDTRSIALEIAYTQSAGTAVTMRCETSNTAATTHDSGFDLPILLDSATAGTSDSYTHTWSNAVSGSESWTWTVANLPHDYLNCGFTATGGGANDKVTVKWRGINP